MHRYLFFTLAVLTTYALMFTVGCDLIPSLDDPHAHDHGHGDEHDEHAETPPPSDFVEDPDLMGQPPEIQDKIKATTVQEAIELLADLEEDTNVSPQQVISYVYRHASDDGKRALEQAAAHVARNSEHPSVRSRCISLMSKFDNSYLDLRIQAARSEPDDAARAVAINTLGEDGAAALPVLRELTADPNAAMRQIAQDMLTRAMNIVEGDQGLREMVRELGIFRNDASALAAIALVVRGEESLPYLVDAVMNDSNEYRRAAAASCIAMICAGNNPYLDEFAKRAQATTHAGQEPPRRDANPAGVEPLLYVLRHDSYGPAREIAAQGLGYLGDAKAVPALAKALADPSDSVRRRAAAALETLPAAPAVKQLADAALRDKVTQVRVFAVRALGNIGDTEAISALARATADRDATVRETAADELGRLRAVQAFDALVRMFDDPDEDTRWAAVRAVGNLRTPEAVPHLIDALRDPVAQVANAAERGLQQLGIAKRKPTGFREPQPEAS
jgi:HEAT repeat protein